MIEPRLRRPLLLSLLAALLTLGLKAASYWVTGSASLLSDAAESLVNLLAAVTAYLSVWYSTLPVDSSHTYGHEKIEFFSSGLEGVLIFGAAIGIAWYGIHRLLWPEPLQKLDLGTALSIVATLINFAAAIVLLRVGREAHSIVLEAEGQHLRTDVWTTMGVIGALGVIWAARKLWEVELSWLDPVVGLILAASITWTAIGLIRQSFDGLMDRALPDREQVLVRSAIEQHLQEGMDYHALRTRRAGARRFVDFHLLVPGKWTVHQAHNVGESVEASVRAALPGSEITVHLEPIEERGSWEDSALVLLEQAAREADARRQRQEPQK